MRQRTGFIVSAFQKAFFLFGAAALGLCGCAGETPGEDSGAAHITAEDSTQPQSAEQASQSASQTRPESQGSERQSSESQSSESQGSESQSSESQGSESQGSESQAPETSGNGSQEKEAGLEELLASWSFDYGPIYLEQAQQQLEEQDIYYAGYYNVSGERLDITLENGVELVFLQTRDSQGNHMGYELMMKGAEFNRNGFQEDYLNQYDVTRDEYFYAELPNVQWQETDLRTLNQTDLSLVRNQIFARYGRKFQDPFLDAVFRTKSWYEPKLSAAEFDAGQQKELTDLEQENLKLILKLEETRGYRGGGDYRTARGLLSGSRIDLDGDGQEEKVLYTMEKGKDRDTFTLRILGGEETAPGGQKEQALASEEYFGLHPYCYLTTMNGEQWQIIAASDGVSSDYIMAFYEYERGGLVKLGEIEAYVESLKAYPDKLLAMVETYHLQCQPLELEYAIEQGRIKWVARDYYEYRQNEVSVLIPMSLYKNKTDKNPTLSLEKGDTVKILGGDLKDWVHLEKTSTGETGWLRVNEMECYLTDTATETSSLCFDGLTFYG